MVGEAHHGVTVWLKRRTGLVRRSITSSLFTLLSIACQPENSVDEGTDSESSTTGDGDGDPGDGDGAPGDELPPTHGAELGGWLEGGGYQEWTSESGVHPSTGPHFGGVRTYLNSALIDSFEGGSPAHPAGAAVVKELYGNGDVVLGWSVMVKLQEDSANGDGWYWYEYYEGSTYADGTGVGLCTGCHGGGGVDYVLTPYPLQ